MTIASSNADRQYIAQAYELDYMHVYDVLLRMVDSGHLRRTKNGRYFWA